MLFFNVFFAFFAFPEREDAILAHQKKEDIIIETSGSLGLEKAKKCAKTFGNETLVSDRKLDWCSSIVNDDTKSYIQYSVKRKQLKIKSYSLRNGCCYYSKCCVVGESLSEEYTCCCYLYSYSLQGSNDKRIWTTLHSIQKDPSFDYCQIKTFNIKNYQNAYKYIRFLQDEKYPNCKNCMQINQIEFYGETIDVYDPNFEDIVDNDDNEPISIIGRVIRNE